MSERARAWRTFGVWACWVAVAMAAVYPGCNWLTSRRDGLLELYVGPELSVPFIPAFVWGYFSMYVLFFTPPFFLDSARLRALGRGLVAATFFSGALFLLLPAKLGFPRVVPADPLYAAVYARLFAVDAPHNLVPSLHVVYTAMIALAVAEAAASVRVKAFFLAWIALIAASTLLVHQHHLLDVAAGFLVAFGFRRLITHGEQHA